MLIQILMWLMLGKVDAVYIGRISNPTPECPSAVVLSGIGTDQTGNHVAILHPKHVWDAAIAEPEKTWTVCTDVGAKE